MNKKGFFIIFSIIILIILWLSLIILKEEYTIFITIIFGFIAILIFLVILFEHFFPKNKISQKLEEIVEWIMDTINLNF